MVNDPRKIARAAHLALAVLCGVYGPQVFARGVENVEFGALVVGFVACALGAGMLVACAYAIRKVINP